MGLGKPKSTNVLLALSIVRPGGQIAGPAIWDYAGLE